ncbi:MAG: hypothetical protein QW782_09635 [Candidatus Bathyarchaeia archaeon]
MEKIKSFSRVLHGFKWGSPRSENRVLVCPRCESRNIALSSRFDAWLMPKRYVCKDCGYIGPIALEVDFEEGEE